jgi:hypothetical protein
MRFVWLIPLALFAVGAGAYYRARRRADSPRALSSEPVSGEWLAQARGREEHRW